MPILKLFIAGAIMACFVGAGSLAVLGIDDVADEIWDGRGYGGGCHGSDEYYGGNDIRDGDEFESPCHHRDHDDGEEDYCPYHDEYFSEAEWEEHLDDCPMDEEEL